MKSSHQQNCSSDTQSLYRRSKDVQATSPAQEHLKDQDGPWWIKLKLCTVFKEPESSVFKISIVSPLELCGMILPVERMSLKNDELACSPWQVHFTRTISIVSLNICFTVVACSLRLSLRKACARVVGFLPRESVTLTFITLHVLHSKRHYFHKTRLLQTGDLMAQNSSNLKLKSRAEAQKLKWYHRHGAYPSQSTCQAGSNGFLSQGVLGLRKWTSKAPHTQGTWEFGEGQRDSTSLQLASVFNTKIYFFYRSKVDLTVLFRCTT